MSLQFHSTTKISESLEAKLPNWLAYAYKIASYSPDTSSQCGAVLLDSSGWEISSGYNKFPDLVVNKYGLKYLLEDRDRKLFYIEHAERNAIYAAHGHTLNSVLVCPWFACADCARAIILSGIKLVIGHKQRMELTPERWEKSIESALDMLDTCGVKMYFYDGNLPANILVNSKLYLEI